jgi:uncharacterized protein (TIGR01319 family)
VSHALKSVLATDCGSTTTKAILIERQGDTYRLVTRGEAPTTVEAPFEDVTAGVLNAVAEVQELRGRKLLDGDRILRPQEGDAGVDAYISTSSAGGGLQVMVAGVVQSMTTESVVRAALGAGAIVMDALSTNDERLPHEKIERIRRLRPDMMVLAGGVDGGTVRHVVAQAELVAAANPRPRLGDGRLPVIYAGNRDCAGEVDRILGSQASLHVVDNVRPVLDIENLGPARDKIHDLFMEHVMAQAPGYARLMAWSDAPIMPTPGAMGLMIQHVARTEKQNVVGVDIGGATTDVFSVFGGTFNRTVSANLGMSYSVSNVLAEAGLAGILRWVPIAIDARELYDRIGNKMIRPTTIPEALDELIIEQAISREALRLAFEQHKKFAVSLRGVQRERSIADAFAQESAGSLVDMMRLDLIVGSGGVLSHAPRRTQAMAMLIDAFQPEGVTELAVDSIFMMPHLGLLSTIDAKAALDVFERDCMVRLGTCIAPVGRPLFGAPRPGQRVLHVQLEGGKGTLKRDFAHGDLHRVEVGEGEYRVVLEPARGYDVGAGPGKPLERRVRGGVGGVVIDCRGRRPLRLPEDPAQRRRSLVAWKQALGEYPEARA